MTPTTVDDRATEQRDYLKELDKELAVLPSELRGDIVRDINEHLEDAIDDPRPFPDSIGTPSDIARSGLEQRDLTTGRISRPHTSLLAKRLQLIVAAVYAPVVILALLGLTSVVPPAFRAAFLLQLAPLLVLAFPPLLARWTSWWRISLLCTATYAVYFITALVFVMVVVGAPWPTSFPTIVTPFLIAWPTMVVMHAPALVLLTVALVRAPVTLRKPRRNSHRLHM